jgi:type VI secretion system protein ImpK
VVRQEGGRAMSDDGTGGERTVFRPTPLQELRSRPANGGGETAFMPASGEVMRQASPVRALASMPGMADEDMPDPPPRARPRNAMLEAAAPLLALIAAVRSGRFRIELPQLHHKATAAATRFDEALASAGYDDETRRRARYAVYATVDDVAQNLPGKAADGAEWARRSMVVRGFGENIGGDRFWMLLQEMLSRPAEHAELIELYHACLAAGFEGRHRVNEGGRDRLRQILTSAYAALPHTRRLSDVELVPAWRGKPTELGRVGFWAPLALAGSILLGVLVLVVLGLRLVLIQTGQPSMATLLAINPDQPLRLSRAAAPPTVQAGAQQQRVQGLLADEIAAKLLVVEEDPTNLRIRTTVGQLFQSGSDALEPGRKALFERIADAVNKEKGGIRIEGHTDRDRIATLTFPDNQALSKARAEAVAAIFRSHLSDPARVTAAGLGATQPIAADTNPEGKALNRRVEIVIPRSQ